VRMVELMDSWNSDPLRMSRFLLDQALERGVQLHYPARAMSVSKDMKDEFAAVRIAKDDGEELDRMEFCFSDRDRLLTTLFP